MSKWPRVRRVLVVLGVVTSVLVVAVGATALWLWHDVEVSTAGGTVFRDEMAVPPLAASRVDRDGTRVFDLRMRQGTTEFRPGLPTPTWGFNGAHLGPTLRAARGEKVRVEVSNTLPEASSVHWHGMRLPAEMDGGPHQTVRAGGRWSPHWTVEQPAATLWYHPHLHGSTEKHVQRGLAGMFLLDDEESGRLPLPKRYGVDDLPVIVQDVRFDGDRFDHAHRRFQGVGFLGNRVMVNGTLDPYREVADERVRLRLLNASTARTYDFGFPDDRAFDQIATDGGLLERPVEQRRIRLSPGERAEIVVRMVPGERTVLRSFPLRDGYAGALERRFGGGHDSFDILQLRAARTLRPSPALPDRLTAPELPDTADSVKERHFDLALTGINDKPMDMDRIDEVVTRGTTETWTVRNDNGMPHNFHVHDVQFRVLDVDGRTPPPALRGRKDTVLIPSGSRMRLVLRFDGTADEDTPYMFHCHLLSHEDRGMMGQFVVVEPGGTARAPEAGDHGGH